MGASWLFGAPTDAVTAMLVAVVTTWIVTLGQARVLDRRLDDKVPAGPKTIRTQNLARHLAADLRRRGLLSAAHLCRHSRARAFRARPTMSRSTMPARGCLRSSPSSISPSPAPPRTNSPNITSPATPSGWRRSLPRPSAGRSGRRSSSAPASSPSAGRCCRCSAPTFDAGYAVMFILAVGMLARAAVGPAERLLNMLGERKQCAGVYAVAFAINLALCAALDPAHRHRGRGRRQPRQRWSSNPRCSIAWPRAASAIICF